MANTDVSGCAKVFAPDAMPDDAGVYRGIDRFEFEQQTLILGDSFAWLASAQRESIHAIITDPRTQLREMLSPDALTRALSKAERERVFDSMCAWARATLPVLRPGAHVFLASTPTLSPTVSMALEEAGLERRGEIVRITGVQTGSIHEAAVAGQTLDESPGRCWEAWPLFRRPLEKGATVAVNLRKWQAGALRRISSAQPFADVVVDEPLAAEMASSDCVPQEFLRRLVRAALPLREGLILDPFAGAGDVLAACAHESVNAIGLESSPELFRLAKLTIPMRAEIDEAAAVRMKQAALTLPGLSL
jgi:site-specific DNA-methyltransferase (adenine-specific)